MTTESRWHDLRLYLVALLALVYLAVWWSLGMRAHQPVKSAGSAPRRAPTPAPVAAPARRTSAVATATVRPGAAPARVQPRRVVRTRLRTRSS